MFGREREGKGCRGDGEREDRDGDSERRWEIEETHHGCVFVCFATYIFH